MSVDPLMGEIAGPGSGPPLSGPGVTPPTLSGAGRRFLSDILVELGFVDEDQAERAVEAARHPGQTPEKVLVEGGTITEDQLARALAERYGLDHIDLGEFPVDESAAALLRKTAAKRYIAAPVGFADDGALVLAVADPADSLGLSDIAVMTKLPVRPAVAARSQIKELLETLSFMQEPVSGASQSVSTVIIPPDGDSHEEAPAESAAEPVEVPPRAAGGDEETERELSRLREELALALVARDETLAKLSSHGEQAASAAEREREEALASLRLEHERALAAAETASEEALRAERGSAQQALSSVRAKHEEELEGERAKRVDEVEAERERAAAAIDTERERNQKELEALRGRLTEELDTARAELEQARAEAADGRAELEKARAKRDKARADADDAAAELEKMRAEAAEAAAELEKMRAELEQARDQAEAAPAPDTGRIEQLERALAEAREQVEVTADADRRAEAARAALAALRDESERQAQVHALTERELRAELESVRAEVDSLRAELPEPSQK